MLIPKVKKGSLDRRSLPRPRTVLDGDRAPQIDHLADRSPIKLGAEGALPLTADRRALGTRVVAEVIPPAAPTRRRWIGPSLLVRAAAQPVLQRGPRGGDVRVEGRHLRRRLRLFRAANEIRPPFTGTVASTLLEPLHSDEVTWGLSPLGGAKAKPPTVAS